MCWLLWLAAWPLCAQTPVQNPAPTDETIKINTDLVVLDVQVIRKKGGAVVSALRREDFQLFEDGVKQEIALFNQDRLPLSVLLLLDLSASVKPVIEEIRNGALQTLQYLKPEDEVAVVTFADTAQMLQPFTRDRRVVVDQIGQMLQRTRVGVGTELHKALYEAAPLMNQASNPLSRRVIIAVTDNVASMYRFTNPTIEEVNSRLLDYSTVACGLVVGGETTKMLKRFTRARNDIYNNQVRVDDFADPTGGEVMEADARDVNQKLAELINHLRVRYSIGYTPSNATLDGRFRRVKLELNDDILKREGAVVVRTRQGYYARAREKKN